MILRKATEADAAAIARVHVDARTEAYAHIFGAAGIASRSLEEYVALWQQRLAVTHRQALVAEIDGEVQGFTRFGKPGRFSPADDAGLLDYLYVAPAFWGHGVGSTLTATAEDGLRAQGYRSAFLATFEENHRARAFYERKGWTFDGTRWQAEGDGPVAQVRYVKGLY